MEDALPMQEIGTLDDLLDRARRGAMAGSALDTIKVELTEMRDRRYRDILNTKDLTEERRLVEDLRAIERLAKALLVRQAQGDIAFQLLQQTAGGKEPPIETPLKVERMSRKRKPK